MIENTDYLNSSIIISTEFITAIVAGIIENKIYVIWSVVVGFILGIILWSRLIRRIFIPVKNEIEWKFTLKDREASSDRSNYLSICRREIANIIISKNSEKFLALSKKIDKELNLIDKYNLEELSALHLLLSKKYPFYHDFDYFHKHIEYCGHCFNVEFLEILKKIDIEELEIYYEDNLKFHHVAKLISNDELNWTDVPRGESYLSELEIYLDKINK